MPILVYVANMGAAVKFMTEKTISCQYVSSMLKALLLSQKDQKQSYYKHKSKCMGDKFLEIA